MKKTLLIAVAATMATFANAQDVIVMKNGDAILSKVQKITQTEIEYKKFSNPDGPVYTVAKSSVVSINYQNGEKEIIKTEEQNNAEQTAATSSQKDILTFGEPDEERNKEMMALVNHNNIKYLGKDGKEAKHAVFQLYATDDSRLANKDIEISFITGASTKLYKKQPREFYGNVIKGLVTYPENSRYIKMSITNRTNKTIFIDLANTFFIRQNEATPYYIPSSTSSTSGSSSGVGVNLGGITGALGVGGALGSLASGVTVGGSSSSGSTTTTYAQRIVSIPPMSKKELDPHFFFLKAVKGECTPWFELYTYGTRGKKGTGEERCFANFRETKLKDGNVLTWTRDNTPCTFGNFITYSFNENMESTKSLKIDFYIQKAVGFRGDEISIPNGTVVFVARCK